MHEKNWENYWKNVPSFIDIIYRWSIWPNYEKFINRISKKNLKILELGSGLGLNTIKILKNFGGEATLIDFSSYAIEKSKKLFRKNNLEARFIRKNILDIKFNEKFDLVFSEGLLEHFNKNDRTKAFDVHMKSVKKGGYVMIFVPIKSKMYNICSFFFNLLGMNFVEYPFTEKEVNKLSKIHGGRVIMKTKFSLYWKGFLIKKINRK